MSDNAPNPGGLGPADNSDITAQTPPIPPSGSQYPPSEWSRSAQPAPGSPSQSPLDWRQTTASQPVAPTPPVAPDPAAYQNPYQSASYPVTYAGPSSPGAGGPVTGGPTPPWGTPAPAAGRPSGVTRGLLAGVAALAIALTAGGVGGFVGYALHPDGSPVQLPAASSGKDAAPVIDRSSLASIAAALQPAIVDVKTNAGEGSGVVVSADGNIVTNNHVVEGARTVSVTFNSGKSLSAKVVGTDPKTDLAVLKVDASGLTFAKWGDSGAVRVGDTVLAIGSPLGLQGSVTAGIVSALHRTITVGAEQRTQFDTGSQTTIGDAIQTDAPINPGNSGGALVNTNGEVIGINSAIATQGSNGNIGVGFAISANKAKSVTDQLASGGKVSHPYLGVSIGDADTGGAKIQSVEKGSPAEKAGLAAGDVVTKVGDRPITGSEDLIGAIQGSSVGSTLKLTVQRGGSEQTVSVTVGEQ